MTISPPVPAVRAFRGRPTGRGRPRGPLLHAVPVRDRTRTALCGERVGGPSLPWPDDSPGPVLPPRGCPECAAALSTGQTVTPSGTETPSPPRVCAP